ncbi:hypothetical protein EST38_g1344 [Candolleomyces aberdarensis]|uniref:GH16 domain-containing protein n=1 Tax=Candolleomyces aberdarensis TaxID=2316362 RepID=A0A4V1Q564_9AGAR|nr:hypothetical protein EST38_g1344 [Candolleomyces aberdarensis]
MSSRPSRRQVWSAPPPPQEYASVPLASPPRASSSQGHATSQGHYYISQVGGPRPVRSRSQSADRSSSQHHGSTQYHTSSHNHGSRQTHRRTSGRTAVAQGVASGQIGSSYGPYSYAPPQGRNVGVYGNPRFSSTPSVGSSSNEHTSNTHNTQAPLQPPPPRTTTVPQYMWDKEPDLDDALHNPDPRNDDSCTPFSWRGWVNASALILVLLALLTLFVGYPAFFFTTEARRTFKGYNIGGINGSGQIPDFPQLPRLVDPDTPREVYTRTGNDGKRYDLVFSDEFNRDGRTFWPGDDPFWEAVDYHYWPTNDWEWYDPQAITTENGNLVITMEQRIYKDLNFVSGMLQTWNKLCFTTGYIEISISLPLSPRHFGLWPGAWTLGNLGRAGYGATTEGMWPYTYDSCDLGTFPLQTGLDGSPGPSVLRYQNGPLSSLPGQRLSACSCPGSDHPGPRHDVGRGAVEVDIIEAEIDRDRWVGGVSQSFQVAPFNSRWVADESEPATTIYDHNITKANIYKGGPFQQAVSAVTDVDPADYNGTSFAVYGYELWSNPDNRDEGYITWYSGGKPAWTATAATVGADPLANISARLISEEPMYVILNLGIAPNFQQPDLKNLVFPAKMYIDYVRIYQQPGVKDGLNCDPPNRPTAKYISEHLNAYMNYNLTNWTAAGYTFPRNRLYDGC